MIRTLSNGSTYKVIFSATTGAALKKLQAQAAELGIGPATLAAIKTMHNWLRHDPLAFGEPLYHLHKLKLQVRTGVILPLSIDYAVYQVEPLVFLKGVKLLSPFGSDNGP
jgi:hypothetical protein